MKRLESRPLSLVPRRDPAAIEQAAPFFTRHGDAFAAKLKANAGYLEEDFAQIQRIGYQRPFEECLTLARADARLE